VPKIKYKSSAVAEVGDCAKNWGCAPLGEGKLGPHLTRELGPHLTQCGRGRGLPAWQVLSWSIRPLGHSTPTLQADRQVRPQSDSI